MSDSLLPLQVNPDILPPLNAEAVDEKGNPLSHGVDDKTLPPSRMLLGGTADEATENEYVVALGSKIVQHACRMMPMKMKLPNGSHKKVPVLVLNEHALAHVLKVMFSGGEVTDETLTWNPEMTEGPAVVKA